MKRPFSRYGWERLPADPDPAADLGYEVVEWDAFRAGDAGGRYLMFLPRDPALLGEEAFVVVHDRLVYDLASWV